MIISLNNLIFKVLLFFLMFPWLSFRLNDFDTQPYVFLFSLIVFFYIIKSNLYDKTTSSLLIKCILFFLIIILTIIVNALNQLDMGFTIFGLVRELINYFTLLFLFIIIRFFILRGHNLIFYLLIYNYTWLIAGALQLTLGKNIFDFLVVVRTSDERGVTGFSPEPSFYGFFLLFLNMIYYKYFNYKLPRNIKILSALNFIFIFFVAQSAVAIVFIFIMLSLYMLYKLTFKNIMALIVTLFTITYFVIGSDANLRVITIINLLYDVGLFGLIQADESVYSRVMSIVYPYYLSSLNYFIPNGIFSFSELTQQNCLYINGEDLCYERSKDLIMSLIGSLFFQIGFISIGLLYFLFKPILKLKKKNIFEFIFLFLILQTAITPSFTLLSILLAVLWSRPKCIRERKYS